MGQGHLRTPAEPARSPLSAPALQPRRSDPQGTEGCGKPPWTGLSGGLSPGAQHRWCLEPSVNWRGLGREALTGTEDGKQVLARKGPWHLSSCFRGTGWWWGWGRGGCSVGPGGCGGAQLVLREGEGPGELGELQVGGHPGAGWGGPRSEARGGPGGTGSSRGLGRGPGGRRRKRASAPAPECGARFQAEAEGLSGPLLEGEHPHSQDPGPTWRPRYNTPGVSAVPCPPLQAPRALCPAWGHPCPGVMRARRPPTQALPRPAVTPP